MKKSTIVIISSIVVILVTNNTYAIEFFPLVATSADWTKTHQGFIGEPIIFQHTVSNDDAEPLDFELLFTTRLPDDTIVDEKTIPVHLKPNETKTVPYQFVPTKEGNFITSVFSELYLFGDSVAFSVLDDSKNYKIQTVIIHTDPSEKNCSRVCTNPSEITVNVGTVVEWLNESPNTQTIQSGTYKEDANGISFSADNRLVGKIEPESKFSFLFLEQGDYKYYFSDHRFLQFAGIIHVLSSRQSLPQELIEKETIPPPLKQFKNGITIGEIKCKENLKLIPRNNGNPMCLTYDSRTKLIERGWTKNPLYQLDDKTIIENVKNLDEVKTFVAKYPNANYDVERDSWQAYYSVDGIIVELAGQSPIKTKRVLIEIDPFGRPLGIGIECGGPVTLSAQSNVIELLKTPNWCFPDGNEIEPEQARITEDEMNLRDAEQKLQEIYIQNSSLGPFNIQDVIVGYGIADGVLIVDVLTEYYESDHLDLIKQKIRDIVGPHVTIEFSPSGAIVPTNG